MTKKKKKELYKKSKYAFLLGTLGTPPLFVANIEFVVAKTQIMMGTALGTVGTE